MSNTIVLSKMERAELNQRATSQAGRADEARRARLILLLDSGHTWAAIREKLDCTDSFIDRWSKRFLAERLAGLFSRHAGQLPTTLTPALEARILEWSVKRKPPDGSTHWSTRKLAAQVGHQSHDGRAGVAQACLCGRIGSRATWPRTIRSLRRKPPRSSGFICIRRSMRRCSASMRRPRSRRWIGSIRSCRCPRARRAARL